MQTGFVRIHLRKHPNSRAPRPIAAHKTDKVRVQERIIEPLDAQEREAFERMCLKMLAHHLG